MHVHEEMLDANTRRLRSLRLARDAVIETERAREAHRRSQEGFWDNIDTSAGPGACHPWTGERRWTAAHPKPHDFEYGVFHYQGCDSYHANRVLCFATFGQEPPKELDVTPSCGNYLCCNLDHLYMTRFGSGREEKIKNGAPVRRFYACTGA